MEQSEDPHELEREIERAKRLAAGVTDQTTYQRLKAFVEELRQRLQQRLAARRRRPRAGRSQVFKSRAIRRLFGIGLKVKK
jgi:hypothetical protein